MYGVPMPRPPTLGEYLKIFFNHFKCESWGNLFQVSELLAGYYMGPHCYLKEMRIRVKKNLVWKKCDIHIGGDDTKICVRCASGNMLVCSISHGKETLFSMKQSGDEGLGKCVLANILTFVVRNIQFAKVDVEVETDDFHPDRAYSPMLQINAEEVLFKGVGNPSELELFNLRWLNSFVGFKNVRMGFMKTQASKKAFIFYPLNEDNEMLRRPMQTTIPSWCDPENYQIPNDVVFLGRQDYQAPQQMEMWEEPEPVQEDPLCRSGNMFQPGRLFKIEVADDYEY